LNASYFSFNNEQGGRCPKCSGTGSIQIDMQFLADVVMSCPECRGTRFQREALDVRWRGMSIADVLGMTSATAFTFFKGQTKLQRRLKSLKDVGLSYLTLGQPLNTLSGGEAQRLKLASMLSRTGQTRSLLLMDEPTIGLHPKDITRLLACFDDLLGVGHSLIVVEHDPQVLAAADCTIHLAKSE
jgi:excinuclease ABC subunit A